MREAWPAESIGSLLGTRQWSGSVASVHVRALNILRPDGLVVSLLGSSDAMTDLGIVVPGLFAGPLQGLQGRSVSALGRRIVIEGLGSIALRGAATWSGRVRLGAGRGGTSSALAAALAGTLARHGHPGGVLALAVPSRESTWSTAARRCLEADPSNPAALVGLGPGMTPSGDDFLAGVLFALQLGWARPPRGQSPARLRRAVAAALPSTTPAGRTLLVLALRGRFAAPLLELATSAGSDEVDKAARVLCALGETSGTDTLVGCWWACMRWRHLSRSPRWLTASRRRDMNRGSPRRRPCPGKNGCSTACSA